MVTLKNTEIGVAFFSMKKEKQFAQNPRQNYLPSCWQAGEIIKERCLADDESLRECNKRASVARFNYANEGTAGFATIFNEESSDWLDSNQCKDCFLPAFNYRPGGSAQYIAALRNFDDNDSIDRFRFGFIASSDNHKARPGTGYKEINRQEMTDATGPSDPIGLPVGLQRRRWCVHQINS